jgi:hypothetical protein
MVNNLVMWEVPVGMTTTVSGAAWATLPCSAAIPETSTLGIFGLYATDSNNDSTSGVWLRPTGTTWATDNANGTMIRSATPATYGTGGQRESMTDGSQQVDYYNSNGENTNLITIEGYKNFLR